MFWPKSRIYTYLYVRGITVRTQTSRKLCERNEPIWSTRDRVKSNRIYIYTFHRTLPWRGGCLHTTQSTVRCKSLWVTLSGLGTTSLSCYESDTTPYPQLQRRTWGDKVMHTQRNSWRDNIGVIQCDLLPRKVGERVVTTSVIFRL